MNLDHLILTLILLAPLVGAAVLALIPEDETSPNGSKRHAIGALIVTLITLGLTIQFDVTINFGWDTEGFFMNTVDLKTGLPTPLFDFSATFSAGVGLDASVVERVDAHPRLKVRLGEYYYAWTTARTLHRHYLINPPRLEAELDDGKRGCRCVDDEADDQPSQSTDRA